MNIDQFWNLVAESRKDFRADRPDGNMDGQIYALRGLLMELPPAEVQSFNNHMHGLMVDAYAWNLWGAATVLGDGSCSDDSFTDFCSWLISMGRSRYEGALADPDSLADVVKDATVEVFFFEEFQYVPAQVFEEMTGKGVPEYSVHYPEDPKGEKEWETEEDLERLYPRLWAAVHEKK
jgi:hypothetical protein